jgi:polar amino acid transport system substrate-binding protein
MSTEKMDAAKAELAPNGTLRVAINLGNSVLAQRNANTSALGGVSVELAQALGAEFGVPIEWVVFDAAGKVFEALERKAWDVAFLAIDPTRGERLAFTPPYVRIEGAYLVHADSAAQSSNDVDREGSVVAVGAGSAYELHLSRHLKAASLSRFPTGAAAFEAFVQGGFDAVGGVRSVLQGWAAGRPGLRLLEPAFMKIDQAMATPKANTAGLAYLVDFIARHKAGDFIAAALQRSGQDAAVALRN